MLSVGKMLKAECLESLSPWLDGTIMNCPSARSLLTCTYVDSYWNVRITEACLTLMCSSIGSNTELDFFYYYYFWSSGWLKLEIVCSYGNFDYHPPMASVPHPFYFCTWVCSGFRCISMVHAYIPIQTTLRAGQTPTLLKEEQGLLFSGMSTL